MEATSLRDAEKNDASDASSSGESEDESDNATGDLDDDANTVTTVRNQAASRCCY